MYEARPAQCRAYDCVDDSRIWIDYAAKIPAPWPWWITPLEEWGLPEEERQARAAARLAPRPAEDGDDADVGEAPGDGST